MLKDVLYFLLSYVVHVVRIVALEGDPDLLMQVAHQTCNEELNELIVVHSLVAVSVDLLADPVSYRLW